MASLRWSPNEDTQDAVANLVQSMRDGLPDLLQMAEFIQGCEVYDLDPYAVGLRVFPRFIQVYLRGEYITDVRYRDNLDMAVGDICIVVRFREGEQYEVFSAGGPTGGSSAFGWPEEATEKFIQIYKLVQRGVYSDVSEDVATVLGRPAINFKNFINAYKDRFVGAIPGK